MDKEIFNAYQTQQEKAPGKDLVQEKRQMNEIVTLFILLIGGIVIMIMIVPWIHFLLERYFNWCVKVQARIRR